MLTLTSHNGRAAINATGGTEAIVSDLICAVDTLLKSFQSEFDRVEARRTIQHYLTEQDDPVGAMLLRLKLEEDI